MDTKIFFKAFNIPDLHDVNVRIFGTKKVYFSLYVSQLILLMLSSITNVLLCHCCIGKSVKLIAPHFHCLYLASFYTSVIVILTNVTFSVQFQLGIWGSDYQTTKYQIQLKTDLFFLHNNELQVFYVLISLSWYVKG